MIYIYILKMLFNISNWLFEYNIFLVKMLPLPSNFVYSTGTELLYSTVNITVPWYWPALHTTESHWPALYPTVHHCTGYWLTLYSAKISWTWKIQIRCFVINIEDQTFDLCLIFFYFKTVFLRWKKLRNE